MNVNRRPIKPLSLMDRACYNGGQTLPVQWTNSIDSRC